MVYKNISKEQTIKIIASILCKFDPVGLCIRGNQNDNYISEAKLLAIILEEKVNFIHFWKNIHDVLLKQLQIDVKKQECIKISSEIVAKLSTLSFAEELRKNPALKNMDDDLCLTIHDYFIVRFDSSGKVFINGEYFCLCEEQDIESLLTGFVVDSEVIYVLFSQKYSLFKKSHIRVYDRDNANIDGLTKNNKVLMIFDNKTLIYKRENLILNVALLINKNNKTIEVYGKKPQGELGDILYSFLGLEKESLINKYFFEDSSGNKCSIDVYNPQACEHSQNYIIIGIADKIVWRYKTNSNHEFEKTFYLEKNDVRIVESEFNS